MAQSLSYYIIHYVVYVVQTSDDFILRTIALLLHPAIHCDLRRSVPDTCKWTLTRCNNKYKLCMQLFSLLSRNWTTVFYVVYETKTLTTMR